MWNPKLGKEILMVCLIMKVNVWVFPTWICQKTLGWWRITTKDSRTNTNLQSRMSGKVSWASCTETGKIWSSCPATGSVDSTTSRYQSSSRPMKFPTLSATGSTRLPMNSSSKSCARSATAWKSTRATCSKWAASNFSCAKCVSTAKNKKQTRTTYFRKTTLTVKYLCQIAETLWRVGPVLMTIILTIIHYSIFVSAPAQSNGCTSIVSNNGSSPNYTSKQVKTRPLTTTKTLHANSAPCLILKVWNTSIFYAKQNTLTCSNMMIRSWVKIKLF